MSPLLRTLRTKYEAWCDSSTDSRKLFVLGCGRSGTTWLGRLLDSHPEIAATIEKYRIFETVKEIALNLELKDRLLPRLVRYYRFEHARVAPLHYADKSHPNIWMAEELAGVFRNALFIGIQRAPHPTVASMLKHQQVLNWFLRWEKFPVPNPFLGITPENAAGYEDLPLAAKCAVRWRSHRDRLQHLRAQLGSRLLVLQYEDLIQDPARNLDNLQRFLGLASPFPEPEVKSESLDRWRSELPEEVVATIDRFAGDS